MAYTTLYINPWEYLSPTTYSHLKEHMPYHQALKTLFTAMEYFLYVGEEYLYELDSLICDEVQHLMPDNLSMDIIIATFNVIVMKSHPKFKLLLDPYLKQKNGALSSIELKAPMVAAITIEYNSPTAGVYEDTPALITRLIKQRLQEVINESDALHHRDLCCLIAGLAPFK